MADYKIHGNGVIRLSDGAVIPPDDGNRDWQAYRFWLTEGNSPDPEFTDADITAQTRANTIALVENLERAQARSVREALLTGDKTRLASLEQQIAQLMGRAPVGM